MSSYYYHRIFRTVFCFVADDKTALNEFIYNIFVVNYLAKHNKGPAVSIRTDSILCGRHGIFNAEAET